VTDGDEIRRLEQTGPDPWVPGNHDHFVKISPTIVHGRRVAARHPEGRGRR
jgi:3',5'-cyclic AMP phosphodiesterase CpdA